MSDATFMCRCEPVEKTFPNAKPIIFNTDMTKAILENRKTVTRRVVKPQPSVECRHSGQHEFIRDDFIDGCSFTGFVCRKCGYGVCGPHFKFPVGSSWIRPPYHPGDILYVRETFHQTPNGQYWYKADNLCTGCTEDGFCEPKGVKFHETCKICEYYDGYQNIKWRPSIHMPREAARIFLRVTDVRVERLQDITEEGALAEGAEPVMITMDIDKPGNERKWQKCTSALYSFVSLWNRVIKPKDFELYSWGANPYVWCVSFERMSKEEAYKRA